ncbi:hypothetical protein KBE46_00460 [Candidatus Saccharibacteria bacterium]|jgi:hypothetical protein|nr:hypothetical protein [Candidatus Saccharibacteria bacterium]MBP9489533.1 hypothetical protein [Candidatus Saccharibacteria bacterium]MBP9551996.1 hypothetical protein [Candidatus Saccharibacteria bacterium]
MKAVVVYKENSDHAREVFDYLRDFERQTGKKLEEIDPEKRENIGFVETYDIVEYPTILALTDNGQVINMWRGRPLPTINEVSFYA